MRNKKVKSKIRRPAFAFTLTEVMIAIILVGLAVASLIGANLAFTKANSSGVNLSTGEFLIEQIRELTAMLPVVDPQSAVESFGHEESTLAGYDDVDDFDNAVFNPPISADKTILSDFPAFGQQVTVENVSATNFQQAVADHTSDFYRITVTISYNGSQISSVSWIRARY